MEEPSSAVLHCGPHMDAARRAWRFKRNPQGFTLEAVRAAVKAEIAQSLARAAELQAEAEKMRAWLDRVEREEQER